MYIYLRNKTYYYRVRIPKSISCYFKKTELHKSLKTANRTLAKKYAKILHAHFTFIHQGITMGKLSTQDIEVAVKKFVQLRFYKVDEECYNHPDPKNTLQYQNSEWDAYIQSYKQQIHSNNYLDATIQEAVTLLDSRNKEYTQEDISLTCKQIAQGHIHTIQTIKSKIDNDTYNTTKNPYTTDYITNTLTPTIETELSQEINPKPLPATIITTKNVKPILTLERAYEDFIRHTKVANNWTKDTLGEHKRVKNYMTMYFSAAKDVNSITRQELLNLRGLLLEIPTRWTQKKAYQGITTLEELCAKAKSLNDATQSSVTVDKILTHLFGFFEYLEINGLIAKNPHVKLRINSKTKGHSSKKRVAYSTKDLRHLLSSPLYTHNLATTLKHNPERLFIPLLAMFQGARMNELCQLYKEDIKQVEGIWCIDINRDRDKSIKNDESVRIIPIHQSILDAGFIEYVNTIKTPRLWSNLTKTEKYENANDDEGSYSKAFSSWYRRAVNRKYITQDPKKVFHSFRHNVVSALIDKNIRGEHIAAIVGHSQDLDMTFKRYGKQLSPIILQTSLNAITYDEVEELSNVIQDMKKAVATI